MALYAAFFSDQELNIWMELEVVFLSQGLEC